MAQLLSSNTSEQDSLSDSDWLDVASSRESDDNDSLASDHDEPPSVSLSRRSSMSLGSSREGDVEAWEGFVDQPTPHVDLGMYSASPVLRDAQPVTLGSGPDENDNNQDTAEDDRVKEGLEQSLISTLSASRSSSAAHSSSTHASLHDLRLSFPDPLTSSKNSIALSRPGTPTDELDIEAPDTAAPVELSDTTTAILEQEQDTSISTPEIIQFDKYDIGIDIILYGSSSASRWSLIEALLQKAASYSHRTLLRTTPSTGTGYFFFEPQSEAAQPNGIAVHDCSQGASIYSTSSNSDRPSLAVVLLPSTLHALPEHTLYLPIILDTGVTDNADDPYTRNNVESTWMSLSIPTDKTLRLGSHSSLMLSSSQIQNMNPCRAHRALQRLFSYNNKKQTTKTLSEHLSSVPAVTFFAFVSIVMSFAINTFFQPPEPTPTSMTGIRPANSAWTPNNSIASATPASQYSTALVASSLKDFALAVINPASTSLSLTSQVSLFVASPAACSMAMSRSKLYPSAQPTSAAASTNIFFRAPPGAYPSIVTKPPVRVGGPVNADEKESNIVASTSALSIRMAGSVSEVLGTTIKAAMDVVHSDLKELIDAMDDLMRAIQDQTRKAMEISTETANAIREEVRYRNARARDKAREIKEKSEQFIQFAGEQLMETTWTMGLKGGKWMMDAHEHIKGKTTHAREKAHGFREKVVGSDAWQMYVTAHEEWVKKILDGSMARREYSRWMQRERREGLRRV